MIMPLIIITDHYSTLNQRRSWGSVQLKSTIGTKNWENIAKKWSDKERSLARQDACTPKCVIISLNATSAVSVTNYQSSSIHCKANVAWRITRRGSDLIMVTPVTGSNKSLKLTRLIASAHNIRQNLNEKQYYMPSQTTSYLGPLDFQV